MSPTDHRHATTEDHFQPGLANACAGTATYGTAGLMYSDTDTTLATSSHATALAALVQSPVIAHNQNESGHDPVPVDATARTALYEVSTRRHSCGAMIPDIRTCADACPGKCHVSLRRSKLYSNRAIRGPVHQYSRRAAATPTTTTLRTSSGARGPAAAVRGCVRSRARRAEPIHSVGTHARASKAEDRVVDSDSAASCQVSDGPPAVPRRGRRGQGKSREPAPALVRAERPVVLSCFDAAAADPGPAAPHVHHVPRDGASDAP